MADFLVRGLGEIGQVRRAQEAMLGDEADEGDVALRQLKRLGRLTHEAALAAWRCDLRCVDRGHTKIYSE